MKNDYIKDIYCKELGTNIKGFLTADQLKILSENYTTGVVMQGMEYRPDKVAAYYLGDETGFWAISAANNFQKGIEDYYLGRSIKIPNSDAFIKLANTYYSQGK